MSVSSVAKQLFKFLFTLGAASHNSFTEKARQIERRAWLLGAKGA